MGTAELPDVVIVGAGFSGLAMAIALQQEGKRDFVVLERVMPPTRIELVHAV